MTRNDEPIVEDALGHHVLARGVGHRVLKCDPPYVMGICGSWGSGKTSFLQKLKVYLGGGFRLPGEDTGDLSEKEKKNEKKMADLREKRLEKWFEEPRFEFRKIRSDRELELIWFNPWQHQFESSPMVALLNEIRQHFTLKKKLTDDAGRIGNIGLHATLKAIGEAAKGLKIPLPSVQGYSESRREYEADNFSASLTSQRFRELFEQAISEITNDKGLLVIFIDDLDRCEGDVAYRLLEALKLYLNAKNCVFVLGLDQQQLENAIAKAFSGDKEDRARFRPMARDYLSKMFQGVFLLPVPRQTETYVEDLLDFSDDDFNRLLKPML
jgi:predicted KAP-like P-loop ATPase